MHRISETSVYYILHWKRIDCGQRTAKNKRWYCWNLINFYSELRRKDGELYSRSSMISIRFGLQRFLQKIKYDIINDPDFRLSNEMFKAVLTNIKRTGKGTTQHKDVISGADMATLYSSGILNRNNPQGLQYKVFLDVMFYTCRRGRENRRKWRKQTLFWGQMGKEGDTI